VANKLHPMSWVNPTSNTDGSAYDAATENAGYTVILDGQGAVSIPLAYGTTFELTQLAVFADLKSGNHTAALAVVNKKGVSSAPSAAATFFVDSVPMAPTGLAVA
jgi:hypothetical protein